MEFLLRPESLDLDHIFGKVLLTLNDSFLIAREVENKTFEFDIHPKFWELLQYPAQAIPSADQWFQSIEAPVRDQFMERCDRFFASNEPAFTMHLPVRNYEGNKRTLIVQVARLELANHKTDYLFMFKDISDRIREKALMAEGQKLLKMGYWEFDPDQDTFIWSETTREIHGVTKDFIPTSESINHFYVPGTNLEVISQKYFDCIERGIPYVHECEVERTDGKRIWVEIRGSADFEGGKCVRVYGTYLDITDRKRVEEERRISEESFRGAFEHASIGMAIVGIKGEWLKVNNSLCSMVGYTRKELSRLTFSDITHPDDLNLDYSLLEELSSGKRDSYRMEKRYYHKNGNIIWIDLAVSMVKNEDGSPKYFVSQITDITQRKNAYEALKNANKRIQGIIDASTYVSIISTQLDGTIVEFNKGAQNLLGYHPDEVISHKRLLDLHKKSEVLQRKKRIQELIGEEIPDFQVFTHKANMGVADSSDWTYVRKDGTEVPVQVVITAIRNSDNAIVGYLGIATDLTERKRAESLMSRMAILESKSKEMEQFAYITSHDLREPLLTITNYIQLIQQDFPDAIKPPAQKFLGYINEAALHLTQLVNGLLEYTRLSNVPEKEPVDLQKVCEQVLKLLDKQIKTNNAKIELRSLPIVFGYKNHLHILFQNLIQNAIKFKHPERAPEIVIKAKKMAGGLELEVRDNGLGIEPQFTGKVFTLFQRLHDRSTHEGTGIGLALCAKIAELHDGKIWVESKKDQGSSFFVFLPFTDLPKLLD